MTTKMAWMQQKRDVARCTTPSHDAYRAEGRHSSVAHFCNGNLSRGRVNIALSSAWLRFSRLLPVFYPCFTHVLPVFICYDIPTHSSASVSNATCGGGEVLIEQQWKEGMQ